MKFSFKNWRVLAFILILFLSASFNKKMALAIHYDELVKLASKDKTMNSVHDVLQSIPGISRLPYVTVLKSESSQQSSPEIPRMLTYDPQSKFVFTFNGHPDQTGGQSIETMQYDEKSGTFLFREIPIPYDPQKPPAINPEKCTSCHGSPPRPRWEPYPAWPGTLGAVDDAMTDSEKEWSSKFEGNRKKMRRYSLLGNSHNNALIYYNDGPAASANTNFGSFLTDLNFKRIAAEFKNKKTTRPFRFALLGAAQCEELPMNAFLPERLRNLSTHHLKSKYPSARSPDEIQRVILKDTEDRSYKHYIDAFDRAKQETGETNPRAELLKKQGKINQKYERTDITARIRYLMEGVHLEKSISNWSMSGQPENLVFNDGRLPMNKYERWQAFLDPKTDGELLKELDLEYSTLDPDQCKLLAAASIAELNGLESNCDVPESPLPIDLRQLTPVGNFVNTLPKSHEKNDLPVVLKQCIQCHHRDPLKIPFDNPSALKTSPWKEKILESISPNLSKEKRMPRGKDALTDQQYKEIARYLSSEKAVQIHTEPLKSFFGLSTKEATEILKGSELPTGAFLLKPAEAGGDVPIKLFYKDNSGEIQNMQLTTRTKSKNREQELKTEIMKLQETLPLIHPVQKNGTIYHTPSAESQ